MSLFDNRPLTEDEVERRVPCECGHTKGQHRRGANCTACDCDEVKEKERA